MSTMFQTHEIGSLAKPGWRVKAFTQDAIGPEDVAEAKRWGEKLEVPGYEALIALLQNGALDREAKTRIREWSSVYAIKLLEQAGLDVVYDGEQQRSEMYQAAIAHVDGFVFRGHVRSFDNKYYRKAACVDRPGLREPYHLKEFQFALGHAEKPLKVPITGAYTLVDWSYDEHYARQTYQIGNQDRRLEARRAFVLDVARHVIRPNVEALVAAGARWIQIDEPAVTTHPDEVHLFVEAFNESTRGIDAQFSTHICFSDYRHLFPAVLEMENCAQFALEFANRDSGEPGVSRQARPGYAALDLFVEYGLDARIGLGVLDVHSDFIELPELVRDRILYAVDVLGDPARINPTPDCGLRTRTWDVAWAKLTNIVTGVEMAAMRL